MGKPDWWPKNPYQEGTHDYEVWEMASDVMCQAFLAYDWDRQAEVRERERAAFVNGSIARGTADEPTTVITVSWIEWAESEAKRRYGGEV